MLGQLSNAVVLGSIYLLFALGLTLSWGVLSILNLAHGSIFMFGAFSAYLITREISDAIPLPVLVVIAAVIGAVLAALLQILVYGPLLSRAQDKHAGELNVLIASIGVGLIPVAVALNLSTAEVVNLPLSVTRTERHRWGSLAITNLQIAIVVLALVLTVALWWWVSRTQTGRALRTIAHSPGTAELMGVPVARMSVITMAVSGALAGTAGLLLAANANAIEAHMGDGLLIKAFAVIILGGVGSVVGAAVGAFALAFAETGAVVWLSGDVRNIIAFALILIVLLVRPQGIFGQRAWQRA
ncbi:branched-chain amino acid ABC transporter permease [Nakamurella sp. YIM 132087]|uniref:Branched-chain amino acid ABC transporter permease n=1 Tax=Nakamurella alba TaxID=2665158 RepID=A0A7K1FIB5_9ACTN|nr:branched-chain amino acid ABC transporter permease [Nakamurella alba]MTD13861.1 branched-chain amino acid ABC transporter permease [Nakamurella alba]